MEPLKPPEPRSDLSIWGDKFRVTNLPTWLVVSILVVGVMAGGVWGAVKIGLVHTGDKVVVSRADAAQWDMIQRHLVEAPNAEVVVRDDVRGKAVCRSYASDGAIQVIQPFLGGGGYSSTFVAMTAPPPVRVTVGGYGLSLAAPAYAGGLCIDPERHVKEYGQPAQRVDPPDRSGWSTVWWDWSDGCELYYRIAGSRIESDANGNPKFTWVRCVGH
jgi:hypothetical protein